MKTLCADGSVGSPHVRVGHRQDLISEALTRESRGFFVLVLGGVLRLTSGDYYLPLRGDVGA